MQGFSRLDHMDGSNNDELPSPFYKGEQVPSAPPTGDGPEVNNTSGGMAMSAAINPISHPIHDEEEPATAVAPLVDLAQFEAIFERFQTPLVNYLYRLVGNREQAYDLAQDVFVKVYRALSSGTTIQAGALSSWVYRIASNTATDALRRRKLIAWLPLSLFNDDRGVGAGMPTGDGDDLAPAGMATLNAGLGYAGARFEQHVAEHEVVQHVLAQLPEKYAVCLLLYEYEGFSCAEIAEMLNISASAVKMRLMRAREKFIALYQQETGQTR
jgi:RNA polymerase sigma-70 factor (ECF subfamily)